MSFSPFQLQRATLAEKEVINLKEELSCTRTINNLQHHPQHNQQPAVAHANGIPASLSSPVSDTDPSPKLTSGQRCKSTTNNNNNQMDEENAELTNHTRSHPESTITINNTPHRNNATSVYNSASSNNNHTNHNKNDSSRSRSASPTGTATATTSTTAAIATTTTPPTSAMPQESSDDVELVAAAGSCHSTDDELAAKDKEVRICLHFKILIIYSYID